jgi:hypothetical protein
MRFARPHFLLDLLNDPEIIAFRHAFFYPLHSP